MASSDTMSRTEILKWLEDHQGQRDAAKGGYAITRETRPNPKYTGDRNSVEPVSVSIIKRTWTANDGQQISVYDDPNTNVEPPSTPDNPGPQETRYEIAGQSNAETRTPEQVQIQEGQAAAEKAKHAEAEWNRANGPTPDQSSPAYNPADAGRGSGIYETHTERISREDQQRTRVQADERITREVKAQEDTNRVANERTKIEQQNADTSRQSAEASTAAQQRANVVAQGQLELGQAKEAREGRTPQVVGTPTDDNPNLVYIDPSTGEIKSGANPIYNDLKTQATQKQKELTLAIEANKLTLDQAAAEYKMWFDKNVQAPLLQAQERRSQATEQRAALAAEEQKRQFQATNEIARGTLGQQAADTASANVRAELPFMTGSSYGPEMASAVNSLAAGGKIGTNAAAGIKFSPGAFSFQQPDFQKISQNATAAALAHLTPYQPGTDPIPVASYQGLNMPDATTMAGAPTAPTMIDYSGLVPGALPHLAPYTPPAAAAAPAVSPPNQ